MWFNTLSPCSFSAGKGGRTRQKTRMLPFSSCKPGILGLASGKGSLMSQFPRQLTRMVLCNFRLMLSSSLTFVSNCCRSSFASSRSFSKLLMRSSRAVSVCSVCYDGRIYQQRRSTHPLRFHADCRTSSLLFTPLSSLSTPTLSALKLLIVLLRVMFSSFPSLTSKVRLSFSLIRLSMVDFISFDSMRCLLWMDSSSD